MRFTLTLSTQQRQPILPLNYQYPLAAAIYKIIERADADYAAFLHQQGYQHQHKTFKLFTFSDIQTPFNIHEDRMRMLTDKAQVTICFHVPDAAAHFIKGLFMQQELHIADAKSKLTFLITQVVAQQNEPAPKLPTTLQPISPMVVGKKNERGYADYLSPQHEDFAALLVSNLADKYAAIHASTSPEIDALKASIQVQPIWFQHPPRHRLITIKAGTASQTQVRGYDKFRLRLTAPPALIHLALDTGLGLHNAMGFGCVQHIAT